MIDAPGRGPRIRPAQLLAALAVMALVALGVGRGLEREGAGMSHPPVRPSGSGLPISSEAGFFLVDPDPVTVGPELARDLSAHPRTLEMYRKLRAYPGAPPRIPHGLTSEEFGGATCNRCHEQGGWVARFGAFAPLTPHAEYGSCLQCHLPRDELVGMPRPSAQTTDVCGQCHVDPDAAPRRFADVDWTYPEGREVGTRAMEGSPPTVPHEVRFRSRCATCHAGPAAIAELRTDHPERYHCGQCHVPGGASSEEGVP